MFLGRQLSWANVSYLTKPEDRGFVVVALRKFVVGIRVDARTVKFLVPAVHVIETADRWTSYSLPNVLLGVHLEVWAESKTPDTIPSQFAVLLMSITGSQEPDFLNRLNYSMR